MSYNVLTFFHLFSEHFINVSFLFLFVSLFFLSMDVHVYHPEYWSMEHCPQEQRTDYWSASVYLTII